MKSCNGKICSQTVEQQDTEFPRVS